MITIDGAASHVDAEVRPDRRRAPTTSICREWRHVVVGRTASNALYADRGCRVEGSRVAGSGGGVSCGRSGEIVVVNMHNSRPFSLRAGR